MVMHTRRALMGSLQLARRLLASDAAAAARLDSEGKDALGIAAPHIFTSSTQHINT